MSKAAADSGSALNLMASDVDDGSSFVCGGDDDDDDGDGDGR